MAEEKGKGMMFGSLLRASRQVMACALLGASWAAPAPAAEPEPEWRVVDVWRQPQGIPLNAMIRSIVQTRDGYLWIGAKAGLARFDGVTFKLFDARDPNQLRDDEVRALAEDSSGGLWIGTFGGGVSVLRDGKFTVYSTANGLPNDFINVLAADSAGGMWIGTDEGLAHGKDGRFAWYSAAAGNAPMHSATAVHVDADGVVWIGTLRGEIVRFSDGKFDVVPVEGLSASPVVYSLQRDRNGALWIGTLGGLFRWQDGESRRIGAADGFVAAHARTVRQDPSGALWVGSNDGLFRRQGERFVRVRLALQEDAANYVYAICVDREDSVWAGAGGLMRLQPVQFVSYREKDGLSYNLVSTLLSDGERGLWVGTARGLNHFDGMKFTAPPADSGLPLHAVSAMALEADGHLLVGFDGGLYRSKSVAGAGRAGRTMSFAPVMPDRLGAIYVRSLLPARDGALWIATNNEGLLRVGPDGAMRRYGTEDGLPDNGVRGLAEDRAGNLWFGTRAGLARITAGKVTRVSIGDGQGEPSVENLFLDRDDVLWVSTRRGVGRLADGRYRRFTVNDGMPANFVISFVDDDSGNLWMSGSKGVFRVARGDFTAVIDGTRRLVRAFAYGREHGLDSPVLTAAGRASMARTADGRVWFGMSRGLFAVDPAKMVLNEEPPPVHIEEVMVNGAAYEPNRPAVAPPGRGDLAFRFTALSFLAPEKVQFRYRLDGYDSQWVDAADRRAAFYSNIPPGEYTFRVIAANNDGVWNQTGARVALHLQPHFYQTYWFYSACVVLVVAGGAGWHRIRTRNLRVREAQLMEMVAARTQDLHARTGELQREVEGHARTEAELRHYKQHLEEQVATRTKAWQESREMLQSVIDSVPAVIYMKDVHGRFLFVNRRYAEQRGMKPDAIVGRKLADFTPENEARAVLALEETALSSSEPVEGEQSITLADGKAHTFFAITCALRNDDQQVYAICGVSTDITHVKHMESQLRQSQKMEAIGRLAGGIAHDFNNLLTGINGYSSLALDQLDPKHPLYDSLREILRAGERAAGLTRQLLAYSRKQLLVPRRWNLNAIVAEMETLLRRIVGEDVHVATMLRQDVRSVLVDRGQVEQIILNLAVNARDAMPQGGRLLLETESVNLDQRFVDQHPGATVGPHAMLAVSDTGHGMTAAVKARLYEPFFTTKEVGKGTGLGLSVVYGIVQQSGGCIAVESEVGRGTTFRIYFPEVSASAGGTGSNPPMEAAPTRGRETILLVEDEELVRNFTRRALEERGYDVFTAQNGREALQHLVQTRRPVDLVVTDAVMPDMGGRELGKAIRRVYPRLPVLYISGYTDSAVVAPEAANELFLQKPFNPGDLAAKVRTLLDGAVSSRIEKGAPV